MKVFSTHLNATISRLGKQIDLNVYADNPQPIDFDWQPFFRELLAEMEFTLAKPEHIPGHVDLHFGDSRKALLASSAVKNQETDGHLANECKLALEIRPQHKIDDLVVQPHTVEEINEIVFYSENKASVDSHIIPPHLTQKGSGIYVNFYGPPGTGKTLAAEIIAGRIDRTLIVVNYANLESELVGRTSKNIHQIFANVNPNKQVLIFDEADSFLSTRIVDLRQSADYGINATRSQLLKELELFQGMVIFATNNIQNYDKAFQRRLHFNVHFPLPDTEARLMILRSHLFTDLLASTVSLDDIAEQVEGFSGGDIRNLVKRAVIKALIDISRGWAEHLGSHHLEYGIDKVRNSRKAFGLNTKSNIRLTEGQTRELFEEPHQGRNDETSPD